MRSHCLIAWCHTGPRAGRAAFAAIVLVALAAPCGAQSLLITPTDTRPSPGWTITPVFVYTQSNDSNVTLAGEDAVVTPDSVATLSPSAEVGYLGARTTMTAGYAGSALRYFSLGELNTFDQRLYVNLRHFVARRVQLHAQASAAWMPTTDTVLLAGVPFLRLGSSVKMVQGGATFALAKHTTASGGYRLEYVDFDKTNPQSSQLLGGHSKGVFGAVTQQVSPNVTVGVACDIRGSLVGGGAQQFHMQNVEGTVAYRFSPALNASGGVGVARISGTLPGDPSRTGPSWHAGIDYRLERAVAYANYQRSYVPSYGIGGTLQNQELTAGVRVPIAFRDRLVVSGSFALRRNEPLTLTSPPLSSFWFNANLVYAFQPWLRVEGFIARTTQNSHLAGGVVQRRQIGVQVVTLAPMRFK